MSEESIRTTAELIRHADAVLVGAGSGLSSAAGYNHYHRNAVFEANFHDFEEAYGIQSLFHGFYYIYSKPEQQWGFYSRYIKFMEDAPAGQPYIDLVEILKDKEYFILTTNCDIQIPKVFRRTEYANFRGISDISSVASHATTNCMKATIWFQPCWTIWKVWKFRQNGFPAARSAAGKWFRGCRTILFYKARRGRPRIKDTRISFGNIRAKSCSCWNWAWVR